MKKNKKKNFMGILILIMTAVLILVVVFLLGKKEETTENEIETTQNEKVTLETDSISAKSDSLEKMNISLGSNVFVTGVHPYIGSYVEDGSDEFVENIMMISMENKGDKNIQLATVTLNDTYIFELTTLLPGKKMLVLEKNKAEYDENFVVESAEISNVAFFDEQPSAHEDILEIMGEDNMIAVKNISGENFVGGKVFYKNVLGDYYLGGITYSGSIPTLENEKTVKLSTKHYLKDSSEIVFITYAN